METDKALPQPPVPRKSDIAVIGMACRFPGADTPQEFWDNLCQGKSSIREVPKSRWDWRRCWGDPQTERNRSNSKWGGFIRHADSFDPRFFGISTREAETMDPQQRIMLELSWECFEDAALTPGSMAAKDVGVYLGVFNFDYKELQESVPDPTIEAHHSTGTASAAIANRISYYYDFKGPSLAIDTACSGSLFALHAAWQALQNGDCDLALAGGVNLLLTPTRHISFSKTGMLSPTGSCKTFDASADGYVRSEGAGLILLKPLAKALEENNIIQGVIKGSAINHGGRAYTLTYPNPEAQARVILKAHTRAKVAVETISYVEAHGTGTPKGDPIEIEGLTTAFRKLAKNGQQHPSQHSCGLGSVKANIGHLESAAGIAGVIKVLLAMRHKTLPGLHNFTTLNPKISLENTPFTIVDQPQQWQPPQNGDGPQLPRRAGVSSFGFGGTNAHVVLEEAPKTETLHGKEKPCFIIALSARTVAGLKQRITNLADWLAREDNHADLAAVSATLLLGRTHFQQRAALVVREREELVQKLRQVDENHTAEAFFQTGSAAPEEEDHMAEKAKDLCDQLHSESGASDREYGSRLTSLAQLYVNGCTFDWRLLFKEPLPTLISLPTYPFARERYWLQETDHKGPHAMRMNGFKENTENGTADFQSSHRPSKISLPTLNNELPAAAEKSSAGLAPISLSPTTALQAAAPPRKQSEPKAAVPQGVRPEELHQFLTESLATALYMQADEVDAEEKFVDIGIDSIIGVEWIQSINSHYDTSITATKLYDYPCLAQFATYLAEELNTQEGRQAGRSEAPEEGGTLCQESVRQFLTTSLAAALYMEETDIDADEKFVDIGVDSIIGVEWTQAINSHFGTSITATKLYDNPCLREFSAYLLKHLQTAGPCPASPAPDSAAMPQAQHLSPAKESEPVTCEEIEPGIIQVTMQDRANKNTFSPGMIQGLIAAFDWVRAHPRVKVVIITGYDSFFASGGTKEDLIAIHEGRLKFTDMKIFSLALQCRVPVIAAMQGHGIGAGWAFGMFCDFMIIGQESVYTSNYMKYGFTPGAGATLIFPEKLGISLAQEILFTGKRYQGGEFREKGTPFTILPRKEVLPHAIEQARGLAESPRESLIALKDQMAGPLREKLGSTHEQELRMHEKTFVNKPEVKARIDSLFGEQQTGEKKPIISTPTGYCGPAQTDEAIAVIGMAGRFPKAPTLAAFWDNIAKGRHCISEIPAQRWSMERYFDPDPNRPGTTYSKWMGVLEDIDIFDPLFFSIPPAEAELMDPQQRLFLESCWSCIEDAGLHPSSLSGSRCGVYAGCSKGDYSSSLPRTSLSAQSFLGEASAILAARISYILNLKGPSLAIDTACSSSLVALNEACNGLRLGTVDLALAGGINILCGPSMHIMTSKAGMLSADGHCYSFDARANGFVPGEGVGVLLLKRLSEAIRDKDQIHGVIRGWGTNQDGNTNGMTAPSANSQIELQKDIYHRFDIDPQSISMMEAHGTGTPLGDPIEFEALSDSFASFTTKKNFCALGSVKSNIGHLLMAAGMAGAIKILLAMRHRMLPPTINFKTPNEHIDPQQSPFFINTALQPWQTEPGAPRRAAISSFGFSGTNAHMVFEEYRPPVEAAGSSHEISSILPQVVVLSAASKEQLFTYAGKLQEFVDQHPETRLKDLAYTLQTGRLTMEHRLAIVAASGEELLTELQTIAIGKPSPKVHWGQATTHGQPNEESLVLLKKRVAEQQFDTIAREWVQGSNIDWSLLHGPGTPQRMSLPTYPFAKERYWLPQDLHSASSEAEHSFDAQPPITPPAIEDQEKGEVTENSGLPRELLQQLAVDHLSKLLAETTKIPLAKLNPEQAFDSFGLDSMIIANFNRRTEEWLGKLDSTLLYRYTTITALASHCLEIFPEAVASLAGPQPATSDQDPRKPMATGLTALNQPQPDKHLKTAREPATIPSDKQVLSSQAAATDIAIIGLAGRYPQAPTLERFWQNLYDGKDCITEIPASRWSLEGFFEEDRSAAVAQGRSYSKWGGFLDNVECFDPKFFNISPRDALYMDPQERLFLEVAWECLEDAGYTRQALARHGYGNRIGVFVGATFNNYQLLMAEAARQAGKEHYAANSQIFSLANRVSYVMNLTGPSLTVDTACSSSLNALHLACESIRSGQSRMAFAGGVNLTLHPSKYITLAQGQFSAADGRCRAFCEGGSGYVPAEAVGAVFLKPLQQAIDDQDHIYGILKGTGSSHAGKTNGYTVPSPVSQSLAIEEALQRSSIDPRTISCIEAHGTGTALGDPIEIAGLNDVFAKYTDDKGFCSISSLKSNIGHAEAAAGIGQLTKVLLQFKHGILVQNVMHGNGLNPNIDFTETPFVVQEQRQEWKRPLVDGREAPRRAGITSIGAGGSNVHLVVEEYIPDHAPEPIELTEQQAAIILLSAKNRDRLQEQANRLLQAISQQELTDRDLVNLAYTLQVGREAMEERLAFTASSLSEVRDKLTGFANGTLPTTDFHHGQVRAKNETMAVLSGDQEIANTVRAWMDKGKYDKVLHLWVTGLTVDWQILYGQRKPQRLSLSTYPFAKERYWVEKESTKERKIRPAQDIAPTPSLPPHQPQVTAPAAVRQQPPNHTAKPSGLTLPSLPASPLPETGPAVLQKPHISLAPTCQDEPGKKPFEAPPSAATGMLQEITTSLAELLHLQPGDLDPEENFMDMGLDPIIAAEWLHRLKARFGVTLTEETLFALPTLSQILPLLHPRQTQGAEISPEPQTASQPPAIVEGAIRPQTALPMESLLIQLAESLAEALYMEPGEVDYDKPFIDMGMDSIVGVEWTQAVNQRNNTTISATMLYDYPSLREFAEFVAQQPGAAPSGQTAAPPSEPLPAPTAEKTAPAAQAFNNAPPQETVRATPPLPSLDQVQPSLAASLAEALYMEAGEVDYDKPFIDMGLDSIVGVEWTQEINVKYNTSLSATLLYDYPTIADLARLLVDEIAKNGGNGHGAAPPESTAPRPASLQELLEQVQVGTVEVDQADQLLQQLM